MVRKTRNPLTNSRPSKSCARCKARFNDDMLFATCPSCRLPLLDDGGGCHRWMDIRDITNMVKRVLVGKVI